MVNQSCCFISQTSSPYQISSHVRAIKTVASAPSKPASLENTPIIYPDQLSCPERSLQVLQVPGIQIGRSSRICLKKWELTPTLCLEGLLLRCCWLLLLLPLRALLVAAV